MNDWIKVWTAEDVQNQKTIAEKSKGFANYAQQRLGVPFPTNKDFVVLRRKANVILKQFPHADWRTLCKIVDYCKARKYRPSRAFMVLDKYPEAWAAGFAPELDYNYVPPQPEVDEQLSEILRSEKRPYWRRRLVMAQGPTGKKEALEAWRQDQEQSSSTSP